MSRTGSQRLLALWALAGLLGAASAARAAPQAGADPATDSFERASLGSNWNVWFGNSSTVGIVNSSDLGFLASSPMGGVSWIGSTFSADQFCETVISPNRPPNLMTQVFVRRRSSDNARYGFHYNAETAPYRWEIKYDGVPSASTRILGSTVSSTGPAPGDAIRVEIQGTTIRGFHNGIQVVSATDTAPQAITTAGPPGMAFRLILGTSTTYPAPAFESWSGGSFVSPPAGDADGDGLPDAWEIQWFGNIAPQNSGGDPDGDGYTNLQEYQAGTVPTDAGSNPGPAPVGGGSDGSEGCGATGAEIFLLWLAWRLLRKAR